MPASALAIDSVYGCARRSAEAETCSDTGGRYDQLQAESVIRLSGICILFCLLMRKEKLVLNEKIEKLKYKQYVAKNK